MKGGQKAPTSKIQARARAVSFDRGRSKRTSAMLMLFAGKLAFKAQKKKKEELKRAKTRAMTLETLANGGMAEACLTLRVF